MYRPAWASEGTTATTSCSFSGPAGLAGPPWPAHAAVATAVPATVIAATARRDNRRLRPIDLAAERSAAAARRTRATARPMFGGSQAGRSPGRGALLNVLGMRASWGDGNDGRRHRHQLRRLSGTLGASAASGPASGIRPAAHLAVPVT